MFLCFVFRLFICSGLAWVFTFTAFVLSAVTVGSCQFVKMEVVDNDGVDTPSIFFWGLYQYLLSSVNDCASIDLLINSSQGDLKLDGSWKAAQAFGVLAELSLGVLPC